MRTVLSIVAAAGVLSLSACESKSKETTTTTTTTIEEATNATDIAETTAAPIDTTGLSADSLPTDSIK